MLEHSAMSLAFAVSTPPPRRRRGGPAACSRDRAAAVGQPASRRARLHRRRPRVTRASACGRPRRRGRSPYPAAWGSPPPRPPGHWPGWTWCSGASTRPSTGWSAWRGPPGTATRSITVWSAADLVEAAARARRTDEVRRPLDRVAALARIGGQPGAVAIATWCRGLLGGPEPAADLATAADAFRGLGLPAGRGSCPLSLGELLRRDRQPRAAREHLRAALEGFRQLGAQVWADRAAAELRASGEAAQAPEGNGLESLTAQELQIVRYVVPGGLEPGRRSQAVHQPADRGVPPLQGLPEARHHLADPADHRFAGVLTTTASDQR